MENVLYFAIVSLIVIITIYAILKVAIKKFNPEESKIKIYGILQGMTNREIISLSCSVVTYIFLLYLMTSFANLDIYIVIITLLLILTSGLLINNKKVIINMLLSLISLGGIKLVYLIHDYITNEYYSMWMLLLLVFVMIFLFLYLSYVLLKDIKTVVISNKFIRRNSTNENKERS